MKVYNTKQFIEKSKLIHGNKFDYAKAIYINSKTKITLICALHGEFKVEPNGHFARKYGCKQCGKKSKIYKSTYTKEKFENEAIKKYGNKYDYSLSKYINTYTRIKIICPTHGEFSQKPKEHLKGHGCKKCGREYLGKFYAHTNDFFIKKSNIIHNSKYDYSLIEYKNYIDKVNIICKKHGIFYQTPAQHLRGQGCPNCRNSSGERKIFSILSSKKIIFETEKKFDKCKNIRKLPFDFYLPNFNICIEFQGIQHYNPSHHMGGKSAFKKLQKNDEIKKEFCMKNDIKLLEIKYNENIKLKLEESNII